MSKKRILIVDDATFMRSLLKDILSQGAYEVAGEATNGQEAVDFYKNLNPDLVTLDITMPVKNGLEALSEILNFDANAKVIMCSAMGQQAMVLQAIKTGAKDFVVKPFQPERVLEAVDRIIGAA
ncbi:MAG: response regulator [Vampirovibrionales bacterium]|nr:response regulator [Vampirovibrionales bacterium]